MQRSHRHEIRRKGHKRRRSEKRKASRRVLAMAGALIALLLVGDSSGALLGSLIGGSGTTTKADVSGLLDTDISLSTDGVRIEAEVADVIDATVSINGQLDTLLCGIVPCVELVTVYEPPDATPPRERIHQVPVTLTLLGEVNPTQVDATGNGVNDLGVAIQADVAVGAGLIGTEQLRLRIDKLAGAPASLPVRAELVSRASSNLLFGLLGTELALERMQSLGYDARSSTAPQGFVADLDLGSASDDTARVRADLQIGTPGSSLAIVHESFDPESSSLPSQREDVQHASLAYSADPDQPGTRVPSRAAIEVTEGAGFQTFGLERLEPTVLELLATNSEENPELTATIDLLPAQAELTIAEVGGGTEPDQQITYQATDPVAEAQFGLSRLAGPDPDKGVTEPHRQQLTVSITDLADDLVIDFSSANGTFDYVASDRVTQVAVRVTDEVPLIKDADVIDLVLDDLPTVLNARFEGGEGDDFDLSFEAPGDVLGGLELRATVGGTELPTDRSCRPDDVEPPDDCDDGLELLRDPELDGVLFEDSPDRFLLLARVRRLHEVVLVKEDDLDALIDTAADQDDLRPTFEASLRTEKKEGEGLQDLRVRINPLGAETRFQQISDANASSECPSAGDEPGSCYVVSFAEQGPDKVTITGLNLDKLPDDENVAAAKDLYLTLTDLPRRLELSHSSATDGDSESGGGLPLRLESEGRRLGELDILITSVNGFEERLRRDLASGSSSSGELCPRPPKSDPTEVPPFCQAEEDEDDGDEEDDGENEEELFPVDGFLVREFPSQYVVHARIKGLRRARVDKQEVLDPRPPLPGREPVFGDELRVEIDADSPATLLLDVLKGDGTTCELEGGAIVPLFGGFLGQLDAPLPHDIVFRMHTITEGSESTLNPDAPESDPCGNDDDEDEDGNPDKLLEVDYSAADPGGRLFLSILPGHLDSTITAVTLTDMPRELNLCHNSMANYCSEPVFQQSLPFASKGSFRLHAAPRTTVDLVTDLGGTRANLSVQDVAFQMGKSQVQSRKGYFAIDTGWRSAGTPPADALVQGSVFKAFGSSMHARFDAGAGVAANRRSVEWDVRLSPLRFAELNLSGRLHCPPDVSLTVRVPHIGDIDVPLDDLCTNDDDD